MAPMRRVTVYKKKYFSYLHSCHMTATVTYNAYSWDRGNFLPTNPNP